MTKLNLVEKTAWAVSSADSERTSSIKGYYKDSNLAHIDAKGSGWYGSDGDVTMETVYEDEDGKIYLVEELNGYKDVEQAFKEKTMNNIKSKLTAEELAFLGVKF